MSKVLFNRFDLWVVNRDGTREFIKSFKDKDSLGTYVKSRAFKKLLKKLQGKIVSVEILQVFTKPIEDVKIDMTIGKE